MASILITSEVSFQDSFVIHVRTVHQASPSVPPLPCTWAPHGDLYAEVKIFFLTLRLFIYLTQETFSLEQATHLISLFLMKVMAHHVLVGLRVLPSYGGKGGKSKVPLQGCGMALASLVSG